MAKEMSADLVQFLRRLSELSVGGIQKSLAGATPDQLEAFWEAVEFAFARRDDPEFAELMADTDYYEIEDVLGDRENYSRLTTWVPLLLKGYFVSKVVEEKAADRRRKEKAAEK